MYICVSCKKEMRCSKNDVGADFGHGHVYPADRFKCPSCGTEILATNPRPSFDPNYKFQDEYLLIRRRSYRCPRHGVPPAECGCLNEANEILGEMNRELS